MYSLTRVVFRLPDVQFADRDPTSDRQCSICSMCPSGFHTTVCSPTTDSKCTKADTIAPAEIVAIVLSVLLVLLVGVLVSGYFYIVSQKSQKKLGATQSYLELTESLLGTEREEKERMGQAWSIDESDLTFGPVIGVGAFGRVFSGTWGCVNTYI